MKIGSVVSDKRCNDKLMGQTDGRSDITGDADKNNYNKVTLFASAYKINTVMVQNL